MVKLIGNAGNQVPTNNMLGNMAFQNKEGVAVDLLGLAAGTAAAPSLIPSGDPNTGVWFPAADTIAMSTNGSERLRLNSSGTLSIGGTTALGRLTIKQGSDAVTGGIAVIRSTTDNQYGLFSNHSGATFISSVDAVNAGNNITVFNRSSNGTAFTESMRIDSDGRLLVGTTSAPSGGSARMAIYGSSGGGIQMVSSANDGGFNFAPSNGGGVVGFTYTGATGSESYTERMRIDSNGYVGIAVTPSPWGTAVFSALQIRGGSIYSDLRSAQYGNTNIGANVYFDGTNSRYIANNAAGQYSIIANSGGTHAWYNSAAGIAGNVISFTQAMTLDASGNLGIGTTSPANRLHASSAVIGYTVPLLVENTNTGVTGAVAAQVKAGTNTGVLGIRGSGHTDPYMFLYAQSNVAMLFGTNDVERMRVDTSGNVVINTAAIATNATNGFLYVPSCPGTPTGTPTAYTGRVPIVVDTTNRKLYFYADGAWRDAGP